MNVNFCYSRRIITISKFQHLVRFKPRVVKGKPKVKVAETSVSTRGVKSDPHIKFSILVQKRDIFGERADP